LVDKHIDPLGRRKRTPWALERREPLGPTANKTLGGCSAEPLPSPRTAFLQSRGLRLKLVRMTMSDLTAKEIEQVRCTFPWQSMAPSIPCIALLLTQSATHTVCAACVLVADLPNCPPQDERDRDELLQSAMSPQFEMEGRDDNDAL
jgi:hypothetical protein